MKHTGIKIGGVRVTKAGKVETVKGGRRKSVSAKIAERKSKKVRVKR